MTREQAKELLPIITAFANGEDVEIRTTKGWMSLDKPHFEGTISDYRIAPKPRKVWVNEYPGFPLTHSLCFHDTKEQADEEAGSNRIACYELKLPPLP